MTPAPTMTLAPTLAPTAVPDMGNVSTFSALSAYCQFDNADITVTGDITFTDQIPITGRTVSITSTTDAAFTSNRSFYPSTGGMLLIEGGAEVTLSGLHFVSGSASTYGGCLYVVSSDLAIFNSSFTSCYAVGRRSVYWCRSRRSRTHRTPTTTRSSIPTECRAKAAASHIHRHTTITSKLQYCMLGLGTEVLHAAQAHILAA